MKVDAAKLKLPGISREGQQLLELLSQPDADLNVVADRVSNDTAAAAAVIKYANSPLYRRSFEIANVRHAVYLLGLTNVRMAVVVVAMRSYAQAANPAIEVIWEHAFGVSRLARMLADIACPQWSDNIVFSALLHDVGALVLASNYPDSYGELLRVSTAGELPIEPLEQVRFGTNHLHLVRDLAPRLRLPDRNANIVAESFNRPPLVDLRHEDEYHHAVIALANLMERQVYIPKGHLIKSINDDRDVLLLALGISDDKASDLMEAYEAIYDQHYADV